MVYCALQAVKCDPAGAGTRGRRALPKVRRRAAAAAASLRLQHSSHRPASPACLSAVHGQGAGDLPHRQAAQQEARLQGNPARVQAVAGAVPGAPGLTAASPCCSLSLPHAPASQTQMNIPPPSHNAHTACCCCVPAMPTCCQPSALPPMCCLHPPHPPADCFPLLPAGAQERQAEDPDSGGGIRGLAWAAGVL